MSARELSREDWQKLLEEPWNFYPTEDDAKATGNPNVISLLGKSPAEADARTRIASWAKRALSILLDEQKAAQLPEGLKRTEVLRRACIARIQLLDDIEAELP